MGDKRSMTTSASRHRDLAADDQRTGRFDIARHGLLGPAMLLDGGEQHESAAALRKLQRQFRVELAPEGIAEELLVERIVAAYWRLRRALVAERGLVRRRADHASLDYHFGLVAAHKQRLASPFTTIDDLFGDSHGAGHVEKVMGDCLDDLERDGVIGGWAFDALQALYRHDLLTKGKDGEFAFILVFQMHLERYANGEPDGDGTEQPSKAECLGALRHLLGDYQRRAALLKEGAEEREGHRGEAEAGASLLPPPGDGERLLRYEAALEGQLYRALHELRALQTERLARAEQVVGAPATLALHIERVNVDVRAVPQCGAGEEV